MPSSGLSGATGQSERKASVEHRAPGVTRPGALVPEPLFGPAPVVNGVVGLHARNHPEPSEPREIFRANVLRVLDAEPVARGVPAAHALEQVQDLGVGAVADGVNGDLNA